MDPSQTLIFKRVSDSRSDGSTEGKRTEALLLSCTYGGFSPAGSERLAGFWRSEQQLVVVTRRRRLSGIFLPDFLLLEV
ncbi:uncharacterized protein V6R79_026152 [Siganus canaliculatus]